MKAEEEKEIPLFDKNKPQRLGEFLFSVLSALPSGKRITRTLLVDTWSKVMGEQAGNHVKVVGFTNKKLRISTDELNWYRSIQKSKHTIIDRLNSHLESQVIEEVEVIFTG